MASKGDPEWYEICLTRRDGWEAAPFLPELPQLFAVAF